VVTANHYLFPNDYLRKEAMHFTWAEPFRASRITEVLGSGRLFSVAEMARLQNDDLSLPARVLVPLTRDIPFSGAAATARDTLMVWDFVLDKDSVAAGIYAMFQRRLLANVRDRLVPAPARAAVDTVLPSTKRVIDWLYAPDGRFGPDPTAARDGLIRQSLEEAVAELVKRFGPDMTAWKYGQARYHHALIRHPLSAAVNGDIRSRLDAGPVPRGGDGLTVTATGNTDNQISGGSFKFIADTEDWDNSIGINTPGQSGDPASPHYRDLFELWATGRYFPVAYSRGKVESVTEHVTRLVPPAPAKQP
jgi:penicillin amidase